MKAVFSFKKELEIDGHEFTIDTRNIKAKEVQHLANNILDLRKKVRDGTIEDAEVIEAYQAAIDYILAEGASETIFGKEGGTVKSCDDLLMFLTNELKNANTTAGK